MSLADFYADNPLWVWLAIGGILLAVEVATGSGWLLWPAAAAAAVALFTLTGMDIGLGGEIALFSILTIIATLAAKTFLPKWAKPDSEDINDRSSQLVGRTGEVVTAFEDGEGRVLVDGAEWLAEIDNGGAVVSGGKVKVVRVIDGARLKVKAV